MLAAFMVLMVALGLLARLVPEMNMGQISREVKRVNQGPCQVEKHNRVDGSLITPDEIFSRLMKL